MDVKKILAVATAVVGTVAMADIVSSSVVGYQTQDLTSGGFTWSVATLKQMDNELESQTLSSFAVPTDKAFGGGDTITLEIYSSLGSLEGAYSFVDTENASLYGLSNTGWYPLEKMQNWEATDEDLSNDVVVPYGKGVIIYSGEADATVTFAGEVITEAKTYDITSGGFTWTGNATPVDLTLGDFAIPTDQSFGGGDTITLEMYGTTGDLEGAYSFVDIENASLYGLTNTGWYPLEKMQNWEATDEDIANAVEVPAGKMVIIYCGEADTTLTLPNPMK